MTSYERAKQDWLDRLDGMDRAELNAELERLRRKHDLCSLGDRPMSPPAAELWARSHIEMLLSSGSMA